MNEIKTARLIKTLDGRAIELPEGFEVPAGFESPGAEIVVVKQGDRLILEAGPRPPLTKPSTFQEMLDRMETIDVEWPDVDEGLLPADDVKL